MIPAGAASALIGKKGENIRKIIDGIYHFSFRYDFCVYFRSKVLNLFASFYFYA